MKTKALVGFIILAFAVLFPLSSLSKSETTPQSNKIVLTSSNLIVLNTQIDGDSTSGVISKAKALDSMEKTGLKNLFKKNKQEPIFIFLNTPGGSIQSGLEMIEALNGLSRPVHTVTLFAASMGFQLVQNLGDRLVLKNGIMMSHHASGEMGGDFGGSRPSQMDSRYQLWLDRIHEMDETTVRRTNGKQTYESYTKQYDHEMWLTGEHSVHDGYSDRIVNVRCDATLNGVTSKSLDYMGFHITYDLDNCPINTSPMNVKMAPLGGSPLPTEMVAEIKARFLSQFDNSKKQSLPMTW